MTTEVTIKEGSKAEEALKTLMEEKEAFRKSVQEGKPKDEKHVTPLPSLTPQQ